MRTSRVTYSSGGPSSASSGFCSSPTRLRSQNMIRRSQLVLPRIASSKGCHASEVTACWWPVKTCSLDLRFRRSQMPIVVSTDPVARTYSDAGLNDRALIASE